MSVAERIGSLVTPSISLSEEQRDLVLEIAFLAVSADRRIQPAEEASLRAFARALDAKRGTAVAERLLARGVDPDRETADAHLLAVAGRLASDDARKLAYKAAYAIAQADLAAADEEFEFDLQLIDALGFDQEVADELVSEVVAALHPA